MRDKDFKMLMEAYTTISKKKLLKEDFFYLEDWTDYLSIELNGKHYKFGGEFEVEADGWESTYDEYAAHGSASESPSLHTSGIEPSDITLIDVQYLDIIDEEENEVLLYDKNPNNTQFNHIGLPTEEVVQKAFEIFKHKLNTDHNFYSKVGSVIQKPTNEP
jgi:hypothetical protein